MSLYKYVEVAEQISHSVVLCDDTRAKLAWLKTAAFYEFSLQRAIRDLYNSGNIGAYIDHHSRLINEQLTKAWREGMKEVDMDPDEMTDQEKTILQEIMDARDAQTPPPTSRAALWANRYREVVNVAKTMAGQDKKFEWVLGPTEHCKSCLKLSGIVKRGSVWQKAGIYPQMAPNGNLECGGWNCQCELVETDKPARRGGFPRLP